MNVLLALDGSQHSKEAAQFFVRLPHQEPNEATILTVVGLPDIPVAASSALRYSDYVEVQRKHGEQVFAESQGFFEGANVRLRHLSKQGHVGHSIITAAEEIKADLIVVGSKGCSNLHRILLGSVSDYVATHASVSVLVVRSHGTSHRSDTGLRIAIGYDDSSYAKAAVQRVCKFPWGKNAEVNLLTVIPIVRMIQHGLVPAAFEPHAEVVREVTQAVEKMVVDLRQHQIHATSTIAEAEHIGESIVEMTKATNPDLIVLGDRGRSGIARVLLGSVSQYVLRHAQQSVLIVRGS